MLRIRVDAEAAQCPLGIKFGAPPSSAPRLLKLASALGLQVVGVSFHVGSGCQEFAVYQRAIRAARIVFDQASEIGYTMTLLDLGGGFAGERGQSLDEAAGYINSALEECFPESEGVTVIAEPGRYMAASAFTLATQVTSVRRGTESVDYYINAGVYGAFNCILYDHQVCRPRPLQVRDGGIRWKGWRDPVEGAEGFGGGIRWKGRRGPVEGVEGSGGRGGGIRWKGRRDPVEGVEGSGGRDGGIRWKGWRDPVEGVEGSGGRGGGIRWKGRRDPVEGVEGSGGRDGGIRWKGWRDPVEGVEGSGGRGGGIRWKGRRDPVEGVEGSGGRGGGIRWKGRRVPVEGAEGSGGRDGGIRWKGRRDPVEGTEGSGGRGGWIRWKGWRDPVCGGLSDSAVIVGQVTVDMWWSLCRPK